MWKILTAQIKKDTDLNILHECKTRRKNLAMVGIDYKKCFWYDPSKLNNTQSQNVQEIRRSHKVCRENQGKLDSGIDSSRKNLCRGKIQRGIFQGDALLTLLFVIAMMPGNTQEMPRRIQT